MGMCTHADVLRGEGAVLELYRRDMGHVDLERALQVLELSSDMVVCMLPCCVAQVLACPGGRRSRGI